MWLPVAIWFFVTGAIWQGIALVAWGMLVIGLMDNLLRPMLVGKATLIPDYVMMNTTLGGMVLFGINGFVFGPVIAAVFFVAWHLCLTTRQVAAILAEPIRSLKPRPRQQVQAVALHGHFHEPKTGVRPGNGTKTRFDRAQQRSIFPGACSMPIHAELSACTPTVHRKQSPAHWRSGECKESTK